MTERIKASISSAAHLLLLIGISARNHERALVIGCTCRFSEFQPTDYARTDPRAAASCH
jgi:hypothetical protein